MLLKSLIFYDFKWLMRKKLQIFLCIHNFFGSTHLKSGKNSNSLHPMSRYFSVSSLHLLHLDSLVCPISILIEMFFSKSKVVFIYLSSIIHVNNFS